MAKSPSDQEAALSRTVAAPAPPAATRTPPPAACVVKLAVLQSGSLREWEGEAAIAEIPKALTRRGARLWIDVCGADPELKNRISATAASPSHSRRAPDWSTASLTTQPAGTVAAVVPLGAAGGAGGAPVRERSAT